jgi:hypothetical protein
MAAGDEQQGPEVDIDIDLEVAAATRISTFGQGTDAHFEVDRDVATRLYESLPNGHDTFRMVSEVAQAFLERGVRYLAGEAEVGQFLVFGSSVVGRANVHQIAREIRAEAKVVYVLFDPVMLVYAHRLLHDSPPGATAYFQARLRDVDEIVRRAGATLDLSEPVAAIMPANLGFVRDTERAGQIVDGLVGHLAPGSHLMATHQAGDLMAEQTAPVYRQMDQLAAEGKGFTITPRTYAEFTKFLDQLDVVEPGVVPIEHWRPDGDGPPPPVRVPIYGAVARKPSRPRRRP